MIMDNRFLVARRRYDPDATRYINAVQLADGQALEPEVAMAVDAFVKGCKADGIWSAIKASCIMCGARTISGALVPLVGTAPTPYNFVAADYDRSGGGLKGDGSTKYLDTNRANNADGQDDNHNAVYVSAVATAAGAVELGAGSNGAGANNMFMAATGSFRCRSSTLAAAAIGFKTGLMAISRNESGSFSSLYGGAVVSHTVTSQTPTSDSVFLFARNNGSGVSENESDARLAFYSIGSSLDLAALDNRVSTLVAAIAAAI